MGREYAIEADPGFDATEWLHLGAQLIDVGVPGSGLLTRVWGAEAACRLPSGAFTQIGMAKSTSEPRDLAERLGWIPVLNCPA